VEGSLAKRDGVGKAINLSNLPWNAFGLIPVTQSSGVSPERRVARKGVLTGGSSDVKEFGKVLVPTRQN